MTKRTIIVGDVHGMYLELKTLIESTGLSREDRVVFVGDLLDKGPYCISVLTFIRSLKDQGVEVVLVKGNHEEKHERFRKAFDAAGEKGVQKFKNHEEMMLITQELNPFTLELLEGAVPFFEMPEFNAVVVHAGILPTWEKLDAADKSIVSRILRVRYVRGKPRITLTLEMVLEEDPMVEPTDTVPLDDWRGTMATVVQKKVIEAGSFISLGQQGPDDPYWANVYDGRFGHVYFGHEPFLDEDAPKLFPHATGMDLGAVFGGHLAAVVLEEGKAPKAVTVKATQKYAEPLEEDE